MLVFFYDPFLDYEVTEKTHNMIFEEFVLPEKIPGRFSKYVQNGREKIDEVGRYFRATDTDKLERAKKRRELGEIYMKQLAEQFPLQAYFYRISC